MSPLPACGEGLGERNNVSSPRIASDAAPLRSRRGDQSAVSALFCTFLHFLHGFAVLDHAMWFCFYRTLFGHCSGQVHTSPTPCPRRRGRDVGKVWAALRQSVGRTRAKCGQHSGNAWARRGQSVDTAWAERGQDMQSASMSKRNRRARKECEVKYASKEPDERGATKGARNPLKRRTGL